MGGFYTCTFKERWAAFAGWQSRRLILQMAMPFSFLRYSSKSFLNIYTSNLSFALVLGNLPVLVTNLKGGSV